MRTDYWYLATPYSKYPGGIEEAFREASRNAALFVETGVSVFCPIAHSHPLAVYGQIDANSHDVWLPFDTPMLWHAHGVIVCMMDSWAESFGVQYEIKFMEQRGRPVIYMTPGFLPDADLKKHGFTIRDPRMEIGANV